MLSQVKYFYVDYSGQIGGYHPFDHLNPQKSFWYLENLDLATRTSWITWL